MKQIDTIIIERSEEGKVAHFYGAHYFGAKDPVEAYRQTQDDSEAIAHILKGIYSVEEFLERLNSKKSEHVNYVWRFNGNIMGQKISDSSYYFA